MLAAVALWLALGGGDSSVDAGPALAPAIAPAPPLALVRDPAMGLRFQHPIGWRRAKQDGVWRLSTPDGSAAMAIAAPALGSFGSRVRRDSVRALRRTYSPSRVLGTTRTRLDGRRFAGTEILGVTQAGKPIRILSLVGATPKRTYSIALFTDVEVPPQRYVEAQTVLRSLRFSGY